MTNEELLCRLFDAHRVEVSCDEVGDVVARVTLRGVTQANFKDFFHAELYESEGAEFNSKALLTALALKEDFERNHDRRLSESMDR